MIERLELLEANKDEQRALIEQQARELTELREWKRIILGTGTDQEAVIRMAATEYTKVAIQSWKEANEKQAKEIARLRDEIELYSYAKQAIKEEHS
ncbi:MAG: hypothetical protein ABL983_01685 [Nitrospira sp.]